MLKSQQTPIEFVGCVMDVFRGPHTENTALFMELIIVEYHLR
jgi:hypothetical protein